MVRPQKAYFGAPLKLKQPCQGATSSWVISAGGNGEWKFVKAKI